MAIKDLITLPLRYEAYIVFLRHRELLVNIENTSICLCLLNCVITFIQYVTHYSDTTTSNFNVNCSVA